MALTAISTPTIVDEVPHMGKVLWTVNGYDTDASTAIEIKAAPGVGKALYMIGVIITSDGANTHPQLQDEDGNILLGRFFTTAEGNVISKNFKYPIKLVSNKALQLKSAASGTVSIYIEGATATG
jgi:hypothetical protein